MMHLMVLMTVDDSRCPLASLCMLTLSVVLSFLINMTLSAGQLLPSGRGSILVFHTWFQVIWGRKKTKQNKTVNVFSKGEWSEAGKDKTPYAADLPARKCVIKRKVQAQTSSYVMYQSTLLYKWYMIGLRQKQKSVHTHIGTRQNQMFNAACRRKLHPRV